MVLIGCQIQRWNCVELRNWVTACFILPTGKWYGMIWALCRCSADSDLILTLPKKKAGAFHPTISNRYFLATTANVWKICCLFLLPLRLGPGQSVPEEPTGVGQLKCWRSHIPYRCAEILSTSNIQQVNNIVVVLLGVHLYSFNSLRLNWLLTKEVAMIVLGLFQTCWDEAYISGQPTQCHCEDAVLFRPIGILIGNTLLG